MARHPDIDTKLEGVPDTLVKLAAWIDGQEPERVHEVWIEALYSTMQGRVFAHPAVGPVLAAVRRAYARRRVESREHRCTRDLLYRARLAVRTKAKPWREAKCVWKYLRDVGEPVGLFRLLNLLGLPVNTYQKRRMLRLLLDSGCIEIVYRDADDNRKAGEDAKYRRVYLVAKDQREPTGTTMGTPASSTHRTVAGYATAATPNSTRMSLARTRSVKVCPSLVASTGPCNMHPSSKPLRHEPQSSGLAEIIETGSRSSASDRAHPSANLLAKQV